MGETPESSQTPLGPGSVCPCCGTYVRVHTTQVIGQTRLQYFHCPVCGCAESRGKRHLPLWVSPRRRRRK